MGTINTSIHTPKTFKHTLSACLFEWCFVEGMSGPLCAAPACARYPQRQREGCQTHVTLSLTPTHTCTYAQKYTHTSACHQASEWHGLCWSSRGHSGVLRRPQTCVGVCVCECVMHGCSQPVHSK